MKITKIGHCCLLIEDEGVRILTDPGHYTSAQNELSGLDAVLITHEHADHLHLDSLKLILQNNSTVEVICNSAVASILAEAGIAYTLLNNLEELEVKGVKIKAFEDQHAEIHKSMPQCANTGFMIANKLFYPGDAFIEPNISVDVLALPVAGPWMRMSEGIDYGIMIHPRIAFPVHDAMLKSPGIHHNLPKKILEANGVEFVAMVEGDVKEF